MQSPSLESRLARLEREARAWRLAALCGGALLLAGAASPAASPDAEASPEPSHTVVIDSAFRTGEIHTRNLVLEGADGKPRATFAELADGTLGLILLDRSGAPRASLGVSPDGAPALKLVGPTKGYAALAVGKDGAAVLGLKSKGAIDIAALPEGQLAVSLNDAAGKPRATLGVKDGTANVLLLDKAGNGGVLLAAPEVAPPGFELRGADGKALFRRP